MTHLRQAFLGVSVERMDPIRNTRFPDRLVELTFAADRVLVY